MQSYLSEASAGFSDKLRLTCLVLGEKSKWVILGCFLGLFAKIRLTVFIILFELTVLD